MILTSHFPRILETLNSKIKPEHINQGNTTPTNNTITKHCLQPSIMRTVCIGLAITILSATANEVRASSRLFKDYVVESGPSYNHPWLDDWVKEAEKLNSGKKEASPVKTARRRGTSFITNEKTVKSASLKKPNEPIKNGKTGGEFSEERHLLLLLDHAEHLF